MRVGIEEIANSNVIGIPTNHINTLLNTANKTNYILSFRSVNPLAHSFLEAGFPTKPLHVKNKTCLNGPAAGLIPVEPLYGRPQSLSEFETYQLQITDAKKHDPSLVEGELVISRSRIKELKYLNRHQMLLIEDSHNKRFIFAWNKNADVIISYATWNEVDNLYRITDDDGQAIMVLGRMINHQFLPITSDYDLLMIGFKSEEWDPKLDQHTTHLEISDNDESCERTKKMIWLINHDIYENDSTRKYNTTPIVHHDQQAHNPCRGSVNDDFPCLFILPKSISGALVLDGRKINLADSNNKILLIENINELSQLYKIVTNQQNNYYLPIQTRDEINDDAVLEYTRAST